VRPAHPSTLVGFSSGGGFVLRVAGSAQQALFDSYLLMSPFLGQDAPTHRPDSGGWVSVGLPRIVGLTVLNALHIRAFNHLEVTRFALNEEARAQLTPAYDYNLAANFRPLPDHLASLRAAKRPIAILAGEADEAFRTDQLQAVVREAGQSWPVQLLPELGHIALLLAPEALLASVTQVRWLQRQP
jgi:alpha-beta hydrolase superfamily lysophospholipase